MVMVVSGSSKGSSGLNVNSLGLGGGSPKVFWLTHCHRGVSPNQGRTEAMATASHMPPNKPNTRISCQLVKQTSLIPESNS